jgi:hypothetical protein
MEQMSAANLRRLMDALDPQSKRIIWHLRCHRHVRLAELTGLIGASADMETLYRLKEVINPAAVKILGQPLLEFCEARIDQTTGKRVLFNWWLPDFPEEGGFSEGGREKPLADVFDEKDKIVIVSEVSPSIKLSDKVKVEHRHGILSITLDKTE